MNKQAPVSIGGIVIAAAWAPNGDVTEIDIAGYDEKRYRVATNPVGCQLRDHVKKSVVVDGVVKPRKDGLEITVQRFRIDRPGTGKQKSPKTAAPHF